MKNSGIVAGVQHCGMGERENPVGGKALRNHLKRFGHDTAKSGMSKCVKGDQSMHLAR
ncbi:MAG TPA: hypothetical protein VFS68_00270 [Candidatus Udaeobacter sp.]|nr:hypothetical protein [Candidatus Udaeobacter sp.]